MSNPTLNPRLQLSNKQIGGIDSGRWFASTWNSIKNTTAKLASRTISFLCGETYCTPQIRTKRDYTGNIYFSVFVPIEHETYTFDSEDEVRVWLEKRYSC